MDRRSSTSGLYQIPVRLAAGRGGFLGPLKVVSLPLAAVDGPSTLVVLGLRPKAHISFPSYSMRG